MVGRVDLPRLTSNLFIVMNSTPCRKRMREIEGVSVLIYDQTCATEKRRRRKRGKIEDPKKRVFINSLVCEGCGDCGEKSFCVSVLPKETEYGRKREIDQSNCNKDYSCVKGFCPSFVTIHGGGLKKKKGGSAKVDFSTLPQPTFATESRRNRGTFSSLALVERASSQSAR